MKKSALVAFLFFAVLNASAQELDTLGWENFNNGTDTLYQSPNGGYAFGNNGYADRAKAQSFELTGSFEVFSALVNFGYVNFGSEDSTSYVAINLYRNDSVGITIFSNSDSIAPGTIWATDTVMMYELDNLSGLLRVDFEADSLQFEDTRFSIGIDLTGMAEGDTLGILSTTDGDAQGAQNAWELTSSGNWIVVSQPAYSWNLDVDLAIFAIVEQQEPASVSDIQSSHEFTIYPNPVNTQLFVKAGEIPMNTAVVSIIDNTGRTVNTQMFSTREGLDVSRLPAGFYMLSFQYNGAVHTSRFVKQ